VRTEKNMQAVDPWCARRTLQTAQNMNTRKLRINQSFPKRQGPTLLGHLIAAYKNNHKTGNNNPFLFIQARFLADSNAMEKTTCRDTTITQVMLEETGKTSHQVMAIQSKNGYSTAMDFRKIVCLSLLAYSGHYIQRKVSTI